MSTVHNLTAAEFQEKVVNSNRPAILDFWAEWCGPCKMFAPIFEQIAAKHPNIDFFKINVDAEPVLARAFSIRSIPTLVGMEDGGVVFANVGALARAQLESQFKKFKKG